MGNRYRRMKGFRCRALAASIFAFFPACVGIPDSGKGLQMTFDVRRELTILPPAAESRKDGREELRISEERWVISMDDTRLIIQKPEDTSIYDFARKRILILYPDKKLFYESQIYQDVDFMSRELLNLLRIILQIDAIGGDSGKVIGELLEIEAYWGIKIPKHLEQKLTSGSMRGHLWRDSLSAGSWEYKDDKEKVFARFKPSQERMRKEFRKGYHRFLIHNCRLHPEIRERILKEKYYPSTLYIYSRSTNKVSRQTLNLRELAEVVIEEPHIPDDYQLEIPGDAKLVNAIKIANTHESIGEPEIKKTTLEFAEKAIAQGSFLDAYLAFYEYFIQTLEPVTEMPLWKKLASSMDDDPNVKKVNSMLPGTVLVRFEQVVPGLGRIDVKKLGNEHIAARVHSYDRGNLSRAIAVSDEIDRAQLKKGYIVDMIHAYNLISAKKYDNAEKLFLNIIDENPTIVSAYYHLGLICYGRYQSWLAWGFWEAARNLMPENPMLEQVTNIEKGLLKQFPEFF